MGPTSVASRPIAPPSIPKKTSIPTTTATISSYPLSSRTKGIVQEVVERGGVKKLVSQYKQGDVLGEGGFAKCYEFTDCQSGQTLAAKVIPKTSLVKEKTKEKLLTEIKVHKKMSHKYIVGFEKFFEDSVNAYILLEMCHCKSMMELMERKKRLSEPEAQYFFSQILSAVKYMHTNKVIHRDLKLGNIFLDKYMRVKIGDFGLAAEVLGSERKTTICGTPNYIAPEILENRGHSYEVDMWSCGVILYTLLIGIPPFETSDVKTTYRKIQENRYSFPSDIKISDSAKKLIKRLLSSDPKARPTIDETINDEFMKSMKSTSVPSTLLKYAQSYCNQDVRKNLEQLQKEREERLKMKQEELDRATPQSERNPLQVLDQNTLSAREKKESGVFDKFFKKVLPQKKRLPEEATSLPSSTKSSPLSMGSRRDGLPSIASSKELSPSISPKFRAKTKSSTPIPQTKVIYHIEYPDYGLAYRLNNGSTGAFFNDWSKMIFHKDKMTIDYYIYQKDPVQSHDEKHTFTIKSFPEELVKKVTLIKYFKNNLDANMKRDGIVPIDISTEDNSVYVKKFTNTNKVIGFRLSNMVVQVKFPDTAEIMLSNSSNTVAYSNTRGEKEYVYEDANCSKDFKAYIATTRDILKDMMSE